MKVAQDNTNPLTQLEAGTHIQGYSGSAAPPTQQDVLGPGLVGAGVGATLGAVSGRGVWPAAIGTGTGALLGAILGKITAADSPNVENNTQIG